MSKNRLDFTAHLQRHSHDVSAGLTSSIAPGMILPQYFDYLQPNDSIYFKTHMFSRFQDVTTAFLGQVDLHIDYFFVPMQMLYTAFGNVFANTNDVISSLYNSQNFLNADLPVHKFRDFFTTEIYQSWKSAVFLFDPILKDAFRLLDHLDYNPLGLLTNAPVAAVNSYIPNGFPADILAYQAIYQKFYRNEEIEKFDVTAFNVDDSYDTNELLSARYTKYLQVRFHQRPNDYFTNVRFSPIATSINALYNNASVQTSVDGGSSSSLTPLVGRVNQFLNSGSQYAIFNKASGKIYQSSPTMNQGGSLSDVWDKYSTLQEYEIYNAQALRMCFALDKFFRVYGRAGKTYDDQILSHFGVKIPHDVKHDITHIKHYHMVLQADPVLSTADTENGALGQIGGNVQSQLDTDEVKFTSPVHGVFMACAYVLTRPRYFQTCNRLHAIASANQFPQPEFDKLGAQPVYEYEFGRNGDSVSNVWENRYQEWKQKYNRVSIVYAHDYNALTGYNNFFSPWCVSRSPYGGVTGQQREINASKFFESPHALDNVMVQQYVSEWSDEYIQNPHLICQTDPILTEFMCYAKKVSWMSPTGEPDL